MIRRASPLDAAAIARVQVDAWHAAYAGLLPREVLDAFDVPTRTARWEENLARPAAGVVTLVAERAPEGVVGFGGFGPSRDEDAKGAGEVWALYAAPHAWGSGVGHALMTAGLELLDPDADVVLWVLRDNARARRFYERAGFRPDGAAKHEQGAPHVRLRLTRGS